MFAVLIERRGCNLAVVAAVEDLLAANALENEITGIAKQVKQNVDAFLEAGGETTKSEVIEL